MKIGIMGYSAAKFDESAVTSAIATVFDTLSFCAFDRIEIVSGLTDLGVPAIAYREAVKRGWKTVGIACHKAQEFKLFPVDNAALVGDEWGDESNYFIGTAIASFALVAASNLLLNAS